MTKLCWKSNYVHEVINIDADFVADEVFWAVDHDTPLKIKSSEEETGREITTDELVKYFLATSRKHFQLAVLGAAGTGKSHLIHRMRQLIQANEGLEILAVSRLETNLHSILEKLISKLPENQQKHYRTELDNAKPALSTPDVQKGTLLDSLAQVIEEDVRKPDSGIDTELEDALLKSLPNMFRDPYLREEKFLKSGEIVPELVDRLFSSKEGKRIEERVHFESSNLPLVGISLMQCSKPARDAIEIFLFDSDNNVPSTLSVINRCLDRAISRSLNFSGDQLAGLLGEIRAYFKTQNKELVILFEEFARLQGYDSAMLEALLVQGNNQYCNIRWALACTTGRFREFPDTVRTRMDGLIDMEYSPPKYGIRDFAGRYLNAVRIGQSKLKHAFNSSINEPVPNACKICPKESECKTAFGESTEGYSLFPFTETALNTLTKADQQEFEIKFNPRKFQQRVLRPFLVDEASALEMNEFPPTSLVSDRELPPLTLEDRERLRQKAGDHFSRYEVLYLVWSEGKLINPPDGVMREFGLEPLSDLSSAIIIDDHPEPPPPPHPDEKDSDSRMLELWVKGGQLDQTLAQKIRTNLFPLIERAIDWDAIGLAPSKFSQATGNRAFRNSSISFVRQSTTGGSVPTVRLELPLQSDDAGFNQAAIAFETLLKAKSTGSGWSSRNLHQVGALFEVVESCASEVIRQLNVLRNKSENWDPIAGAIELLLVGSALGGTLSEKEGQTDERLIEALFKSMPQNCPQSTRELQILYDLLVQNRDKLQELLRVHVSATKGGQLGRFINPAIPLVTMRNFIQRSWKLRLQPKDLSDPYNFVGVLYKKFQKRLQPALSNEHSECSRWLSEVEDKLGTKPKKEVVLEAVDKTLRTAAEGGLPGERRSLEQSRDRFAGVQFSIAVEAAEQIRDTNVVESELPHFARVQRDAMEATEKLIFQWIEYLNSTEEEVQMQHREIVCTEVSREANRLITALVQLDEELCDL